MFGRRVYETTDTSRNTLLVALITGGEGWHNNHHRYPWAARQGFRWWQIDMTYYVLRVFSLAGRGARHPAGPRRGAGRGPAPPDRRLNRAGGASVVSSVRRRRGIFVTLVVAGVLTFAACGSSSKSPGTGSPAGTSPATTAPSSAGAGYAGY